MLFLYLINFDILKLENYVDNDDVLNLMVCNYKFYECFFSEIYNDFFEDFRGNIQGEKNIFGIFSSNQWSMAWGKFTIGISGMFFGEFG